jgi:hypothetical protein
MGTLSYQSLLKSPIARHSSDESGKTPATKNVRFCWIPAQTLTDVIGRSVAKHIIKCFFLEDVLRRFSDDDSQFYFVIWDVLRNWLGSFGNVYGCVWADDSGRRLVEEGRGAEKKSGIRASP